MKPFSHLVPSLALAVLLPIAASAAVSIDIDLAKLRAVPDAAAVRTRLEQAMPASAKARLAALDRAFGFDPRRDLSRVIVTIPDAGAPNLRLVGLPAERMGAMLTLAGRDRDLGNGVVAHPLPRRPTAGFVVVGPDQALIGRLEGIAAPAALPPMGDAAITAVVVPGPHPVHDFMTLVARLELRASGDGHIAISVEAKDAASGDELMRRLDVAKHMVQVGADGKLPRMQRIAQLIAATTVNRSGQHLDFAVAVPAEIRHEAIERLMQRIETRMHGEHEGASAPSKQKVSNAAEL